MTCNECQLQIFDGELDVAATAHLGMCEDCRELDREVRLNSAALAELRDEPVPTERRPRRWQPWVATIAAAAASVFVLWGPREYPPPPEIKPPVVAGGPSYKPEIRILRERPIVKPKMRIKRQAKPKPVEQEQPLLVKFITEDPEVVVYWIVEPNQGEPGL